ncbi:MULTISPECIES: hypothetical protein [unclassified Pseudoxanthomonas]|uniref:hypothetical protein n=1 Tax=unclassified Pseudoxanthomonas TaxID=2645906 RepID=UPI00161D03CF|nr:MULTISPECIES: hypothetical protein [unclassified Pseudoxanthomonas]MBB3277427.1 hypothetical protein [Pseudoxanthomonas sp. OG2]MBV7474100.1 hypothetical protein [Pseudoxanthomonas sp. PXM05]
MKFSFDALLTKASRLAKKHGGDITVNLPFLSFSVAPDDIERRVAREILIRLADKRVLSSKECCDNCIDNSLASLQEIRSVLVEKQVELSALNDGSVFLLTEYIAEGIRQFLTATEHHAREVILRSGDSSREMFVRENYFQALELLRFHIHSCLFQLSKVAGVETPRVAAYLRSEAEWHQVAYTPPAPLLVAEAMGYDDSFKTTRPSGSI